MDGDGTPDLHPGRTVARLARPTSDDPTRLAVIADPHVATRAEGTSKLYGLTERHLRAALADAGRRDVDAVVSPGDLTKDGEPWNYEAVDDVLAEADVGAPFHAVPGNHDVPKADDDHETPPVARFEDAYTPGGLPFATAVGGVDLVGINTAGTDASLTGTHEGAIDGATVRWLSETLPDLDAPVVVAHHNLPSMHDQLRAHRDAVGAEMGLPPGTRDAAPFVEALADADAPLLLTGHLHMPGTAVERGVREVMAPTTCSFPQAYLLVDVGPRGTVVRFVPVADAAGLRDGYRRRAAGSTTARELTAMASLSLARFPFVDEWSASADR